MFLNLQNRLSSRSWGLVFCLFALNWLGGSILSAQTHQPPISTDINFNLPSSSPEWLESVGDFLYMSARAADERELYTTTLPSFLPNFFSKVDVFSGTSSSNPTHLTGFQSKCFFSATGRLSSTSPVSGGALWAVRASPLSRELIKDFIPGGNGNAQNLAVAGNFLFLAASSGTAGNIELWRSDGTTAGTVLERDINTNGTQGSLPQNLTEVIISGEPWLFFSADDGTLATPNRELWARNPNTGNTFLVRNLRTVGSSNPRFLVSFDDACFFIANGDTGPALWRSDGTSAGTQPVNLGGAGIVVDPTVAPVVSGDNLYFAAGSPGNVELWRYSASTGAAALVRDINAIGGSNPGELTDVNGELFFVADSAGRRDLYTSTGTAISTQKIPLPLANNPDPIELTKVGTLLYFFVRNVNPVFPNRGYFWYHDPVNNISDEYFSFGQGASDFGQITPMPNGGFYFVANANGGLGGQAIGTEIWHARVCPTITLDYNPSADNTICDSDSDVNPIVRASSGFPPSCPSGNCYSATPAGLSINSSTGVIDATASTVGTYTVTFSTADANCTYNASVEISIRENVSAERQVTTVASGFNFGTQASDQGNLLNDASVNIAFSPDGSKLYICDELNHAIRELDIATGTVSLVAGGTLGINNGVGASAQFNRPSGIDTDIFGNLYVADKNNHAIRRININTREVTTVAGTINVDGDQDSNNPLNALFRKPTDVALDPQGNIYVTDGENHKIKKISTNGMVTSLTGTSNITSSAGYQDSTDPMQVRFAFPSGLDIDSTGNLYVADLFNHVIRQVAPDGTTTTLAGSGPFFPTIASKQSVNGAANTARFFYPVDVSVANNGRIYVADRSNHQIKVIEGGQVTTYAGSGNLGGPGIDSVSALNADFRYPSGVAADFTGEVYVTDKNSGVVRRTFTNEPAGRIEGSAIVCPFGNTGTLTLVDYIGAPNPNRVTRWETSTNGGNTWVSAGNAGNDQFNYSNVTQTTLYRVVITDITCGELISGVAAVEINNLQAPTIVNNAPVCLVTPSVEIDLVVGGGFDGEYRWFDSPTNPTPLAGETSNTLTRTISDTTTFYVAIERDGCLTNRIPVEAIAVGLPNANFMGPNQVCENETVIYTADSLSGHTYTWTLTGGGRILPADTTTLSQVDANQIEVAWGSNGVGTIELTVTNPAGCDNTVGPNNITINTQPTPVISGQDTLCLNDLGLYSVPNSGNDYIWTVNGGIIAAGQNTNSIEVNWSTDGIGEVIVLEVDSSSTSNCTNADTIQVLIEPIPAPVVSGIDTVCVDEIQNYTTPASGNNFTWTVNGGTLISGQNTNSIQVEWNIAGTGEVILEEINPLVSCPVIDTLLVDVNAIPTPAITGIDTVCTDQAIAYSVVDSGNQFTWTVNGGSVASGQGTNSVEVIWDTPGAGSILIEEGIAASGCSTTDTLDIIIFQSPNPGINGNVTVCEGDTTLYQIFDSGNTFTWSISNGTIVSGQNTDSLFVVWTGPNPGQLIITEEVTASGCVDRDTLDVTINPFPTPAITGNASVCEADIQSYSILATSNQINWIAVNGSIMSGQGTQNVAIEWSGTNPGMVIIEETIVATGCSGRDTLMVTIDPIPQPEITGDLSTCQGDTLSYTIVDSGNTINWSISQGTILSGQGTDSIRVVWNGTSPGSLIVEESIVATGCANQDSIDIEIIQRPNTDITGNFDVCESSVETYLAAEAPAGQTYIYTWTVSGGVIVSGQNTRQIEVEWLVGETFGTLSVDIQVAGSVCMVSTPLPSQFGDMGFVRINQIPNPTITSTDGLGDVCETGVNVYTVVTEPGNSYQWNVSTNGIIESGQGTNQVSVRWQTAGVGTLSLRQVVDSSGCFQNDSITVNVLTSPTPPVAQDRTICEERSANLRITADSSTAVQYIWYDVADGGTPLDSTALNEPFATPVLSLAGSPHTFYVAGQNAAGCEGARTPLQVTVDPNKVLSIVDDILINVETCDNDTSGLLVVEILEGVGPYDYEVLQDGAPFASGTLPFGNNILRLESLGVGRYTVSVVDDGGCTGTADFDIIFAPKLIPDARIEFLSPDFYTNLSIEPRRDTLISVATGDQLELIARGTDAQEFQWIDLSQPGTIVSMDSTLALSFEDTSTVFSYQVIITNDKGCTDTVLVSFKAVPIEFFVPNTFSPNSDLQNDVFQVYGLGIGQVKFRVFNRLGQLLFEGNDWIEGGNFNDEIGWDGNYNGTPQPSGNYVWSVKGRFVNGQEINETGSVVLIR